jgi:hypothetical protein
MGLHGLLQGYLYLFIPLFLRFLKVILLPEAHLSIRIYVYNRAVQFQTTARLHCALHT